MVLGFCVAMLPWIIRNQSVTGHWVLTSLWSGPSLYDGLNPNADGSSNMEFFDRDNVMATMSEYEMNSFYQAKAIQFVRENPWQTAALAFRKLLKFLQPVPSSVQTGWVVWVMWVMVAAVFLTLCMLGVRTHTLDLAGFVVVLGPFLLFLMVHLAFVGSLRYRLPTEFPLAILAAAGLTRWLPGRNQGR
jgi:hypothetical protein